MFFFFVCLQCCFEQLLLSFQFKFPPMFKCIWCSFCYEYLFLLQCMQWLMLTCDVSVCPVQVHCDVWMSAYTMYFSWGIMMCVCLCMSMCVRERKGKRGGERERERVGVCVLLTCMKSVWVVVWMWVMATSQTAWGLMNWGSAWGDGTWPLLQ